MNSTSLVFFKTLARKLTLEEEGKVKTYVSVWEGNTTMEVGPTSDRDLNQCRSSHRGGRGIAPNFSAKV